MPALDSSDVPPMARMPSFLLIALRKVFAISLLLSSWKIWRKSNASVGFVSAKKVTETFDGLRVTLSK